MRWRKGRKSGQIEGEENISVRHGNINVVFETVSDLHGVGASPYSGDLDWTHTTLLSLTYDLPQAIALWRLSTDTHIIMEGAACQYYELSLLWLQINLPGKYPVQQVYV